MAFVRVRRVPPVPSCVAPGYHLPECPPTCAHRTADGRLAVVVLTKQALLDAPHGGLRACQSQRHEGPPAHAGTLRDPSAWPRLFVGDSVGARSLPPPYAMWQLQDEVRERQWGERPEGVRNWPSPKLTGGQSSYQPGLNAALLAHAQEIAYVYVAAMAWQSEELTPVACRAQ